MVETARALEKICLAFQLTLPRFVPSVVFLRIFRLCFVLVRLVVQQTTAPLAGEFVPVCTTDGPKSDERLMMFAQRSRPFPFYPKLTPVMNTHIH